MSIYRTPHKTAQELARRANDDDFEEAFLFWCDVRGKSGDFGDLATFVDVWPTIKRERLRLASLRP
jgi:hypothetical protein